MRRALRIFAVSLTLVVSVGGEAGIFSPPASAQEAGPPEVFSPAATPARTAPSASQGVETTERVRYVKADLSLFPSPRANPASVRQRLSLTLFDDVRLTAVLNQTHEVSANVVSWSGEIEGTEFGNVTFVVQDGKVMAGNITMGGAVYAVRWASDGVHAIVEQDLSEVPEDQHKHPDDEALAEGGEQAGRDEVAGLDDGSVIDVLVLYTPAARTGAGGQAQVETAVNLAIQETNNSYANSGVIQRLRLVHQRETQYTESGSFLTDLDRLTDTQNGSTRALDGIMDEAHSLRNQYAADLVALVNNPNGAQGGIGWIMGGTGNGPQATFERYAFSVSSLGGLPFLTLAHELGHNMGGGHDQYTQTTYPANGTGGAFSYSKGYVDPQPNPGGATFNPATHKSWVTVMAYQRACTDFGNFNCARIQAFSAPGATGPDGGALGVAGVADNAATLNNTRTVVANFRNLGVAPISPSGNIGTNTSPTFTFTRHSEATHYRLWVAPSSNTGSPVLDKWYPSSSTPAPTCNSTTCSVNPGLSLGGGNYTWYVAAYKSAGNTYGNWSWGMVFIVGTAPTPGAATLFGPSGNASNQVTYSWGAAANATWYYLWVDGPNGNVIKTWYQASSIGCGGGGTCSVSPAVNLSPGSYNWWIQTWNSSWYGPWSGPLNFTIPLPVGKATLLSPNGTVWNQVTYRWNPVSGATWYYLYVDNGSQIKTWYQASAICGSVCSVTPSVNLGQGGHTWWIQTWSPNGYGPWSDGMNFSLSPPTGTALYTPDGPTSNPSNGPNYFWSNVPTATWYRMYIQCYSSCSGGTPNGWVIPCSGRADKECWISSSTAACADDNVCGASLFVKLTPGTWRWYIQTYNPNGYGPWSAPKYFTISS